MLCHIGVTIDHAESGQIERCCQVTDRSGQTGVKANAFPNNAERCCHVTGCSLLTTDERCVLKFEP